MKLNGHVDIIRGVSYKPSDVVSSLDANSVGILRANNIANGEINTNEMVYVDQSRVSDAQRIRIGDIIVCASSGSQSLVGKAAINKNLTREYAHGAFCLLIRCNNTILPKYLNIYLQTALYRNQIESLSCGSNILNIKAGHLTSLDIPIPDIKQQSDFVTIIEQADKSKFVGFKSQFIEMFKGDDQVPLGDICNIEKGATITRNDVLPGDIPVVAGGQEPSCYHNVANREAGAITVSASGAYAGYINLWSCPIFASDCNTVISKDAEKTDQTFVYFGLKAMQKQIYGLQKGGAQPHVYGKDLQKFMFPHPSYAKQIEFSKMAKQADKSKYFS